MPPSKDRVDVLVIGAGASGAAFTWSLAEAGIDALCLEQGPWTDSTTYPAMGYDWEVRRQTDFHPDPNVRRLRADYPVETSGSPIDPLMYNAVGGSTIHWSAHFPRLRPSDFRVRSLDGAADDWPLTYDELEPYYDRFDHLVGASGFAGNLNGVIQPGGNPFEPWRSRPYPNPPMRVPHAPALFGEAAAKLGYHPYIQPSALSTRPYVNSEGLHMNECVYCGFCSNFGCEQFAKASPQVCILPVALKLPTFELRTGAHVLRVELDKNRKHARGVTYVDAAGVETFQPAEVVILCAFAINNTRLLLLSGIGRPYDPATGKGVVGRNYTHQTSSSVSLFFEESVNINPFMGAGAVAVTMDDFCTDNFDHGPHGFVGGGYIQIQVVSGAPIGNRPTPPGTPGWGSAWKKAAKRYYNHSIPITITGSALPVRGGYLSLDPTYKDAWGQPLLRITYDFPDNDIKLSAFLTEKGTQIGRAMRGVTLAQGNPRTKPYGVAAYQSSHINGGAAIGADPATSVVNRYGQCWDVPNVFVTGAALFPQNSCYNPTGTIGALAYWTADAIRREYVRAPGRLIAS